MPLRFPRLPDGEITKDEKKRRGILAKVIKNINKSMEKKKRSLRVSVLNDSIFEQPVSYVSSGILPLDCVVCFGVGFPTGIIEIFGGESTGKSAIVENTLAEAQRNGFYTVIFAQEFSLDKRKVKVLGLNKDELLVGDAETIEDIYDQIKTMVRGIRENDKETPIVIGWDSVAATPTNSELQAKAGLDSSDMGRAAQQISKLFRRLVRFLFRNKVCLLCTNQTRSNLAIRFGNKESTFGGKALKFYAWVRIRMSSSRRIEDPETGKVIGQMCSLQVVKNKVAPPFGFCKFPIFYDTGIDTISANWEFAIDQGIFKKKGTSYRYNNQIITRKSFKKYYRRHKTEIDAALRASVKEKKDV